MAINPAVRRLGYPPDARLVIFHADDVGMCHGANTAFFDLLAAGIVQTGSIMVPCPWAPAVMRLCAERPEVDVGVHLTLTSEWEDYRWGPINANQMAGSLVDGSGHFWHRVPDLVAAMDGPAAVAEMRAQCLLMEKAGIAFTHIDSHMGVALVPALVDAYVELGFAFTVPVFFPRAIDDYMRSLGLAPPDEQKWLRSVAAVEERGMPLVDWFRITPDDPPVPSFENRANQYEEILSNLLPGITYFSLHPNAAGDIEVISPRWAGRRLFEHEYFRSDRLRRFLAQEEIIPLGYTVLRDLMRAA